MPIDHLWRTGLDAKPDHVAQLLDEEGIGGELEATGPVRLQTEELEEAVDCALGQAHPGLPWCARSNASLLGACWPGPGPSAGFPPCTGAMRPHRRFSSERKREREASSRGHWQTTSDPALSFGSAMPKFASPNAFHRITAPTISHP